MRAKKETQIEGLGLDNIGDLSGLLNDPEETRSNTKPMEINLDKIDEDPNQPRTSDNPGFSKESLEELAATIYYRGVKTPISVRENKDKPGRFIINHGARRFRASRIANRTTIPAFIDNDYNEADQIIENLQRNELTAREIADYIGRELAKGAKKAYIASSIGKSPAFVSQHVTLLDLPEPIAEVFNSNRVNDVTVINELVKAYKKNPDQVVIWLNDDKQEITRGSVKLLREYLDDKIKSENKEREQNISSAFIGETDTEDSEDYITQTDTEDSEDYITQTDTEDSEDYITQTDTEDSEGYIAQTDTEDSEDYITQTDTEDSEGYITQTDTEDSEGYIIELSKVVIKIKHNERIGQLILNKKPSISGWGWIKYDDDDDELEIFLKLASLISIKIND